MSLTERHSQITRSLPTPVSIPGGARGSCGSAGPPVRRAWSHEEPANVGNVNECQETCQFQAVCQGKSIGLNIRPIYPPGTKNYCMCGNPFVPFLLCWLLAVLYAEPQLRPQWRQPRIVYPHENKRHVVWRSNQHHTSTATLPTHGGDPKRSERSTTGLCPPRQVPTAHRQDGERKRESAREQTSNMEMKPGRGILPPYPSHSENGANSYLEPGPYRTDRSPALPPPPRR